MRMLPESTRGGLRASGKVLLAALLGLGVAACSSGPDGGTVVPPPLSVAPSQSPSPTPTGAPTATPTGTSSPGAPAGAMPGSGSARLDLVAWGGNGRVLSMVVRNSGDRTVLTGRVMVKVYDHDGTLLRATTGPPGSKCCTVLGLPPKAPFGLFLDMHRPVSQVGRVTVSYTSVRLAERAARPRPHIEVGKSRLTRTRDDAVVTTTFTAHGDVGDYVAGQAFLVGPGGKLRAVISGRFYCYADDASRTVRMQLLRRVPPRTRIGKTVAYPIPRGVPVRTDRSCH